jgi:hypothetical protein
LFGAHRQSAQGIEKPFDDARVGRRGFEKYRTWDLAGGVPERERDNDDIVEWPNDREELGNEVDGRQQPEEDEPNSDLGAARHPRVGSQPPYGGCAGK